MADQYRSSLDDPNVWVPYRYHPSQIAAITFVVAFSLTTILHIFQVCKKRTWYFIPLVIGGIFEVLGYIGRILSTNDLWALGPFIMQSLLLLIAPALFAASIYIVLGRIILLVDGEQHSLIRQRWLTKIFVTGDVISFLVQAGGGGIQAAGSLTLLHAGEKVIVVGLFLQLTFFGFFIIVAGLFHYRFVKSNAHLASRYFQGSTTQHSTKPAQHSTISAHQLPWKRHMHVLYIASGLIMIRSVFRLVEYLQGNNGYLLRHEVYLYIFDALLMLVVMCHFNWVHPAQVTDLYQKRVLERDMYAMETRDRYMQYEAV
ncbi:RTA1-domain-containing protein [Macroventuria anomochaeta]|uniref:RTA1-domain-containing protein n=1 Tax=Macroventuria anomochaeta TaxID=301207 RepID=A0ACB6RXS4_9PLEO|nr:RTA1-domain-containing protein [Macroventuria anomochaeta]KAF2626507.1 RTA1-domain-containing protein [Macroventuria anomochaeta]